MIKFNKGMFIELLLISLSVLLLGQFFTNIFGAMAVLATPLFLGVTLAGIFGVMASVWLGLWLTGTAFVKRFS